MRQEVSRFDWQWAREQVDRVDGEVLLGGIPRTSVFSSLTGQNYQQMASYFDLLFPKHYFWHRGIDGMVGSIARWVKRLGAWNPSLTVGDRFVVVEALLGIRLPGVQTLMDLEMGLGEEFFSHVVYTETLRAWRPSAMPARSSPGYRRGAVPTGATRCRRASCGASSRPHRKRGCSDSSTTRSPTSAPPNGC